MPRRILQGTVTSTKMQKTVTVEVERRLMHPLYKKFIKITKKYHARNEDAAIKEGDKVQIMECKPIAKTVSWFVLGGGKKANKVKETKTNAKE
ncbi:MAG: 30S ribosomal protein S17 [Rickettsiales bacterium]|jgi:small subunit ribosomal protein S17|nr:30S ribosomal protein S17 [Rickettsiales bacterium]